MTISQGRAVRVPLEKISREASSTRNSAAAEYLVQAGDTLRSHSGAVRHHSEQSDGGEAIFELHANLIRDRVSFAGTDAHESVSGGCRHDDSECLAYLRSHQPGFRHPLHGRTLRTRSHIDRPRRSPRCTGRIGSRVRSSAPTWTVLGVEASAGDLRPGSSNRNRAGLGVGQNRTGLRNSQGRTDIRQASSAPT